MPRLLRLILVSAFLGSAIHSAEAADPDLSKLQELLSSPNPIEVYQEVYPRFRFFSQSILQNTASPKKSPETENPESTENIRPEFQPKLGRSDLMVDGEDRVYLDRKLLTSDVPFQLWIRGREVYLKEKETEDPQKVTYQREFQRWSERAIKEVLSLFENLGKEEPNWQEEEGQKNCASFSRGELCLDQASGLPVSGRANRDVTEGLKLSAQFELTDLAEDAIVWPQESQEQKVSETP